MVDEFIQEVAATKQTLMAVYVSRARLKKSPENKPHSQAGARNGFSK
jgi:hypothetical protein